MTVFNGIVQSGIKPAIISAMLTSAIYGWQPASATITITSDPILYWNDIAITRATVFTPGGAPVQARAYAMVNIAMHDAVNATRGNPNRSYLSGITTPGGDSRAAAAQAAHDVLVALNPANTAQYDSALADSLALIGGGAAKTNGVATGAAYAAAILANRAGDGWNTPGSYERKDDVPGYWRPTPDMFANPALPAFGNVSPFVLSSVNDVPVAPPPALGSAAYAIAYNEVKEIGSLNSATRTDDQTKSALFWDISNGGTWIRAGLTIAEDEGLDTLGFAQVFATLSTSIADSLIAGFDTKYDYRLWRPITAIRLGGTGGPGDADGNAATVEDANWNALFATPAHPSYVSTHSAQSGAAATILKSFFGDDEEFEFLIGGESRGRKFANLSDAELDAANSRLWGGIHFRFDNEAGLALGQQVGTRALRSGAFGAVPEPSAWAMMIAGFGLVGASMRRRRLTVSFV